MSRRMKKRSKKAGLLPGTLVYIGEKKVEETKITVIHYDELHVQEKEANKVEQCFSFKDKPGVTWINVDGLHEVEILEKLGQCFDVPLLVLEDILNTDQRPKMEDLGPIIYIVLKMFHNHEPNKEIVAEQVSVIVGSNFVLSCQEHPGDVFDPVRQWIRSNKGCIRRVGADYLAYALLDAIVDNYFIVLEKLGEKIELIEEELLADPAPKTLQAIHHLKREVIFLRKSVWPLRDVICDLEREEVGLIQPLTRTHLRDVYDHTIQVVETIETFRDLLASEFDLYMSSLSNRINRVMQVLTIIATIFIPLTFITSIYGMNFYIPEVRWPWGYPAILFVMSCIALLMLVYFRKKRWL